MATARATDRRFTTLADRFVFRRARRLLTMTDLPLHALDPDLLARALPLLDDEWLAKDADLAPVLPMVLARGVGQDWHKAGTFRHHLVGVARSLALWQQPREVRLLGLLHSVYGNAFVDLVKFDAASERGRLRALIGDAAEEQVYLFCTASRREFVQKVLAGQIESDGSVALHTNAGEPLTLAPGLVASFIIVSMADTIEQWFSWQDDACCTRSTRWAGRCSTRSCWACCRCRPCSTTAAPRCLRPTTRPPRRCTGPSSSRTSRWLTWTWPPACWSRPCA